MTTKLLHCEKIVSDISEGLWLTIAKVIPYFLPSLAILSIATLEELYFASFILGIIGDSIIMPSLVKIEQCSPEPDSNDIEYLQEWKKQWRDIDFEKVVGKYEQ